MDETADFPHPERARDLRDPEGPAHGTSAPTERQAPALLVPVRRTAHPLVHTERRQRAPATKRRRQPGANSWLSSDYGDARRRRQPEHSWAVLVSPQRSRSTQRTLV